MGVTGNEHAFLVEGEEKTLLSENDREVEGFSSGMSDFCVFEKMRNVFSPSWDVNVFVQKLLWGSIFRTDDLNPAEQGLGGNPDLVDEGLDAVGISIHVILESAFSKDLVGICR